MNHALTSGVDLDIKLPQNQCYFSEALGRGPFTFFLWLLSPSFPHHARNPSGGLDLVLNVWLLLLVLDLFVFVLLPTVRP